MWTQTNKINKLKRIAIQKEEQLNDKSLNEKNSVTIMTMNQAVHRTKEKFNDFTIVIIRSDRFQFITFGKSNITNGT